MEESNLFIQWDTHHATFIDMLPKMRIKEQYCDATILCEEHFYKVHKFVLATCSSYFEQIFSRLECKHPMIVLTDIKAFQLEALLTFMYNGKLRVSQKNLKYVLQAANSLKIKGLSEEYDDEVDLEINREVMTPHIQESSQRSLISICGHVGRENNRLMDLDSKPKAVEQKRQTGSPRVLTSSSSTIENNFEVIEISTDMQPPTDSSFMNVVESDIVSAGGSENHEALMLWNERFDCSFQNDIAHAQNCNINSAVSPSVESMFDEIEVKNESFDLTPEADSVFNSNCLESTRLCISNQADSSRATQQNSLQDKDNELSNQNAPSTSIIDNYHNSMTMASNRGSLSNGVIENSSVNMYYPVELCNALTNTHENLVELNNTVESISEQYCESRTQSYSSDVAGKNSRDLSMALDPAKSHAILKQNKIVNTLPCTKPPDNPVPFKRGRGRPKKVKNLDCSKSHRSMDGSGTILEMQDNNLGIKITQNANGESQKGSHNSHTVCKAKTNINLRKKKCGPHPILESCQPCKRKRKLPYKNEERNTQRKSPKSRNKLYSDSQTKMQRTGIQNTRENPRQLE